MQYLGGKTDSSIGKKIAAIIAPKGLWLEPFCGGLSVSVELAKFGPGIVCDGNKALISLYKACYEGWIPPIDLSKEEYQAARLLPDTDPLKAFVGFGCSFGGKWFAGHCPPRPRSDNPLSITNYAKRSSNACVRDTKILREAGCKLAQASFFDIRPVPRLTLYCDPPYAGTEPYGAMPAFDSVAFWVRCREWAAIGSEVYVSEYSAPSNDVLLKWEHTKRLTLGAKGNHIGARTERLYYLAPKCP